MQDLPQEDKMALRMTAIDQVLGTHEALVPALMVC